MIRLTEEQYAAHKKRVSVPVTKAKKRTTVARKAVPGVPSEFDEQCAVLAWWRASCASYGLDSRLLAASVNGSYLAGTEKQRAFQSHRLKQAGMVAGDPDLMLRAMRSPSLTVYGGLFIEMKRKNWKHPKSWQDGDHYHQQTDVQNLLFQQGYRVRVCAGAESAIAAIREYLA